MIDNLDWHAFLQRWSDEVIAHRADLDLRLSAEAMQSGWIGRPPATPAQIAAAEERLGRSLPTSLREFYLITNGWPCTSFDFGEVVGVEDLNWYSEADPTNFGIWSEPWDDDDAEAGYGPMLERSVLVSDGADQFLLDTGAGDDGEWTSFGVTSWYPGVGDEQPTFRVGLESHYASFVRFDATDRGRTPPD